MTYAIAILRFIFFFFFNDTATTEIYTLSLHDALPISRRARRIDPNAEGQHAGIRRWNQDAVQIPPADTGVLADRKSTRLNSSHGYISYSVFCFEKKKKKKTKLLNKHRKHQDTNISYVS